MAHFELIDNPFLTKKTWLFSKNTRLFVTGKSGDEKIAIQKDIQIVLEQTGTIDPGGKELPVIFSTNEGAVEIVKVTRYNKSQTITIKGKGAGKAQLKGKDSLGNITDKLDPLTVVSGDFKMHPDMEVDLIYDICRGSDPGKIHAMYRMLNSNEDNIFNENWESNEKKWGLRACGTVSKVGGETIWGGTADSHSFKTYHIPLKANARVTDRSQVKYDTQTMARAKSAIAGWLHKKKQPVVVGVIYGPSPGAPFIVANKYGQIERTGLNGHSVLVVGSDKSGSRLLYIDPWMGGSKLKYPGGIVDAPFEAECEDLGIFSIIDDKGRGPRFQQAGKTEGTFRTIDGTNLEIISGP